ncbi:MAG TPA: PASTA domain-containing protein [Streptosporangiaceae bacterium]|nr:PASTA domain-containing protein [Streptosporangiaceae bacterium]
MEIEPQPDQLAREPSQADRDAALASLREEVARGRLTLDEFGDRVDAVLAAENNHDLTRAMAGVDGFPAGGARTVSTVVAFLGAQRRAGRWRLPGRLRVLGILGDVHLDLGSACCAEETVEINAWGLFGDIALDVPDGVDVELSGFDLFGNRQLELASVRPLPGTPRIRVKARAAFGDVSVRSAGGGTRTPGGPRPGRGGSSRRRVILAVTVLVLVFAFLIWDRDDSGGSATAARPVTTPSAAASASASEALTAPDVVGERLVDAQAKLDAAGFVNVKAVDATSEGRVVLNPRNWVVRGQSPSAGMRAPVTSTVTLKVTKPSDAAGAAAGPVERGVVPRVVCMDLQAAQDRLRAAGFTDLRSRDGSGRARMQLVDRNWVVTAQSPAAGRRHPATTPVLLTSVKYGEPTGSSGCPN